MEKALEELKSSFYSYRTSSVGGKRISEELKKRAVLLLSEHSVKEVSSILGVSAASLRNWQKRFLSSEDAAASPHFVSLPLLSEEDGSASSESSDLLRRAHIVFPCGASLELLSPNLSELLGLTQLLLGGAH